MPNRTTAKNNTRQRVERKARNADQSGADLDELDALGDERFVETIGQFTAKARQKEKRRNQCRAGELDQ